ncbi:hypothetical protein DY000_02015753 [Brassica cretica]|uniref:K Homology domain-containing protein n=1 Tax=Brassica cretica TaxID=69181 RepID=A0ABQ7D1B0_BRACR|nr:hypothetical protein DY000_02015753 [Brassica cretica]
MVATLILGKDENGDLHDQEGDLCNVAGQRLDDQRAVITDQDDDIATAAHALDDAARPRTLLGPKMVTTELTPEHLVGVKIGHDGIDVRKSLENLISVKTSKAEIMNSRNGSPGELGRVAGRVAGELGRDTGQLARSDKVEIDDQKIVMRKKSPRDLE